jgi:hypothetical protein
MKRKDVRAMATGLSGNNPITLKRPRLHSLNSVESNEEPSVDDRQVAVNPFEQNEDRFIITRTNPHHAMSCLQEDREAVIQFFTTSDGGKRIEPETPYRTSYNLSSSQFSPSISPSLCKAPPADLPTSKTVYPKKRQPVHAEPVPEHQQHHHATQPLNAPPPTSSLSLSEPTEPSPVPSATKSTKTKKQGHQQSAALRQQVQACYQKNPTWSYEQIATQCNTKPERVRNWLLPVIQEKVWELVLKPAASYPDGQ